MAKAVIVTLADDVVDQLNAKQGGWAVAFKAERKYQPKVDFEDTDTIHVQVVPLTWSKAPYTKSTWKHEYVIGVGIHYRANPKSGDQAAHKFDDFLKLVEEISDYWEETRPTVADCPLMKMEFGGNTGAPYAHEVIETKNQFTSVIQLTFEKYR